MISAAFMACNSNKNKEMAGDSTSYDESSMTTQTEVKVVPGKYTDLNTGKTVYIISDPQTGWAVDSISRVPVEFYIDNSGDTLFQTGLVVNNAIMRADGKWMLDETKIKRDGDKIKINFLRDYEESLPDWEGSSILFRNSPANFLFFAIILKFPNG